MLMFDIDTRIRNYVDSSQVEIFILIFAFRNELLFRIDFLFRLSKLKWKPQSLIIQPCIVFLNLISVSKCNRNFSHVRQLDSKLIKILEL